MDAPQPTESNPMPRKISGVQGKDSMVAANHDRDGRRVRRPPRRGCVTLGRWPAAAICSRSVREKRKCFPSNVHGIARIPAWRRSQDSFTARSSPASAGVKRSCGHDGQASPPAAAPLRSVNAESESEPGIGSDAPGVAGTTSPNPWTEFWLCGATGPERSIMTMASVSGTTPHARLSVSPGNTEKQLIWRHVYAETLQRVRLPCRPMKYLHGVRNGSVGDGLPG